jgi:hypothetical protein
LPGTVEAIVVTWCNGPVKAGTLAPLPVPAALAVPAVRTRPASRPAVAVMIAASVPARLRAGFISVPLPCAGKMSPPKGTLPAAAWFGHAGIPVG